MIKKGMKIAACVLAGAIAFSVGNFSTNATSVSAVLPAAGLALILEEGTSVEEIQKEVDLISLKQKEEVQKSDSDSVSQIVSKNEAEQEPIQAINIKSNILVAFEELMLPVQMQKIDLVVIEEQKTATADLVVISVDNLDEADFDNVSVSMNEVKGEDYSNLLIANVNDYVNIRSIPSTDGEVVGKLYGESVGELISETDGWYEIKSGSVVGFVKAEYFIVGEEAEAMIDEVSTKIATVATTTLKVRSEASMESSVLQLIPMGDNVTVVEELDGWVKVSIEGNDGYVSSEYVTVKMEFITAESKAEEEARLKIEAEEKRKKEAEQQAKIAEQQAKIAEQANRAVATTEVAVTEAPTTVYSAESSESGIAVANYALQFVGNPYVYGGVSLTNGADCSGFVLSVYGNFGVSLPHSANADKKQGYAVDGLENAQPGDLLCYSGHVGIYIGGGQVVHASTSRTGIIVSKATYNTIQAIRRIF